MQGVTNHVSAPKSNTDWKTDLKKNTDTRDLSPSLIRILVIIFQIACAFIRFRFTTCQSSSAAADITLPGYLKYNTILRVRP